jgi:hypothetical protein
MKYFYNKQSKIYHVATCKRLGEEALQWPIGLVADQIDFDPKVKGCHFCINDSNRILPGEDHRTFRVSAKGHLRFMSDGTLVLKSIVKEQIDESLQRLESISYKD